MNKTSFEAVLIYAKGQFWFALNLKSKVYEKDGD